jgi:UDP-N-acetyl-D-glucosamine dehydrogenase
MSTDKPSDPQHPSLSASAGQTPWELLSQRIESHQAVVGVLGLGYVGLPLAVELARSGYRVLGFDISDPLVAALNRGESHIQDVPGEVLATFVAAGTIEATSDLKRLGECDAISICVPTPLNKT